ncbi:MAG TPA: metal-dependent hydrolase [Candidatus Angelobacter sp.]|nr:metal-dependent hydrolase [Candidatus Angelobacter sp.]
MSPVTHFFAGWVLACASPVPLRRREKALVVAAAVAPDLDGLGIIPELLTRHSSHPLLWFSEYHHSLHILAFALICTITAFLVAGPLDRKKMSNEFDLASSASGLEMRSLPQHLALPRHPWITALLVFVSFHLHLLCDLVGARGPDGYQWPIPYLEPFSNAAQLAWHGQWALNGWQNFVITGLLLAATMWIAWRFETSPLELVSESANRAFTRTLRQRFPLKTNRAAAR